jgi:hypothetical protein
MTSPRRFAIASLLAASSLLAPSAAQCPPGPRVVTTAAPEAMTAAGGALELRLRTAEDALQRGDLAAARQHFAAALAFDPASAQALLGLGLAHAGDEHAQRTIGERLACATADAQGRSKLDAALQKRLRADRTLQQAYTDALPVAAARATALNELVRFVDRQKPQGRNNADRALLVAWAHAVAHAAAAELPQAMAAAQPAFARVTDALTPDYETVFRALQKVATTRPPIGVADDENRVAADRQLRAARLLIGLERQSKLEDLEGPKPPDVERFAADARRVLDDHHAALQSMAYTWSIAELEAMSPEEAQRFTAEHRDWIAPGIALSTTGRYRIETTCGHATLLGVAKTIEQHHARLVDHFGKDPFVDRPGLVRIVPESGDLETEGAPHWWAAGFQSGDRTTVRFAWGTLPALGHTLTHELTHRFDGVLRPFLPAWYVEGHADWTGGHYAATAATKFTVDHLRIGTVSHTWYKGYGNKQKFTDLLAGKVEDYRDNYFAGYSLYAFLTNWPPNAPRYAAAMPRFEQQARGGQKDPVGFFTAVFCDGKQGRPASFDELFGDWQTFARGCYDWSDNRREGNEWVGRYGALGQAERGPLVMDAPTWSWARTRHEPFFGQDHAALAARVLLEAGDHEGAVAAGVWSLTVDGWRLDTCRVLAEALVDTRNRDAAAAFHRLAGERFPEFDMTRDGRPGALVPRVMALLDLLVQRGNDDATLRRLAGAPEAAAPAALPGLAKKSQQAASGPAHLALGGYAESRLAGYDERRKAGLWHATALGELHVGREQPREGTGALDRTAHQRDAFVHTVQHHAPGDYVLRGRVDFTTSFVSGAIVFGHTRRDRDVRLQFSSGDFDYATGRSESNRATGRVSFALHGAWERDGQLPGTNPRQAIELDGPEQGFRYVVHVSGPRVSVEIDGKPLFHYTVHDGAPIEGQIGFATSMGAIRVSEPTIERLDSTRSRGLDVAGTDAEEVEELIGRRTHGLPTAPTGTLVLWLPPVSDGSPVDRLERSLLLVGKLLNDTLEHPQPWQLAVPEATSAEDRAAAQQAVARARDGAQPTIIEHRVNRPLDGSYPWVLFVDAAGVLRAAASAADPQVHTRVARWARMLRPR